jgi:hypothetical protein
MANRAMQAFLKKHTDYWEWIERKVEEAGSSTGPELARPR